MSGLAKDMAGAIKAVHGVAYVPEQSSQLYRTAGDTTDWTYGTYAIPSFTIELRPSSAEEGGSWCRQARSSRPIRRTARRRSC
ncbi:MAG TPA: M14 family zinc carboxypeptidase [Beijerinckiaceae bacterium]|nr:M14 family zinc carboxypeptidase [Beijerinckiaceae bacterium]